MGRVKSVYAVLAKTGPDSSDGWAIATYVKDTEAGRKWIKKEGIAGSTYLIVAFRGEPVTVKVQATEKRTLVAAPAVAEPEALSEAEGEEET